MQINGGDTIYVVSEHLDESQEFFVFAVRNFDDLGEHDQLPRNSFGLIVCPYNETVDEYLEKILSLCNYKKETHMTFKVSVSGQQIMHTISKATEKQEKLKP